MNEATDSSVTGGATAASRSSRSEFFRDDAWRIVAAALTGAALGLTALPFYSLGVFAKPLAAEFAWTRAVVQSGITSVLFGVLCSAWAAGALIDRFGVRPVALASQAGLALGFVGLALSNGDPLLWRANWFLLAMLGVGTTPLTWSRGIASWFERERGLAIGIALSGTGVTAFVAPPLLTAVIASHGWRAGYLAMAAAIVVVGIPVAWFAFRARPASAATDAREHAGLTLGEALRGRRFWVIALAFALLSMAVGGIIPNLIPMLTDAGLTAMDAARYASLLGLAVIAGRLVAGWLLDRLWAPLVAVLLLLPPAGACLLLASHTWPGLAAIAIGLAGGAEFDLIAYLCLRYFGMRGFGAIYAWQWASFSAAAGVGPLALAVVFDRFGSYRPALFVAAAFFVLGPLLLLLLGRYPGRGVDDAR